MKYIPGFAFTIGIQQSSKPKGGSLLQNLNKKQSLKGDEDFVFGNTYKLFNISKVEDKFRYTFTNQSAGNVRTIIEFDNPDEADKKISSLIGAS